MKKHRISKLARKFLEQIHNKRAKVVIDHILSKGFITTEELTDTYHYEHAPRAARDVREAGVPLVTFKVKNKDGRSIAAYKFGDLSKIRKDRIEGRAAFPKQFKEELFTNCNGKCQICLGRFESRYLQIDHRIPYEVAGDKAVIKRKMRDYMLVCSSCNRAKSWSCEHCVNWNNEKKSPAICSTCYWSNSETYSHIALRNIRRIDVQWEENEIKQYELLSKSALEQDLKIPDYVKKIIGDNMKS